MPGWGWALVVAGAFVVGAALGFGFAAWLIGMNERDQRAARDAARPLN